MLKLSEMCRLQGLPEDFLAESPFTMTAKRQMVGNGVPLFMGRVLARATRIACSSVEPGISAAPAGSALAPGSGDEHVDPK